MGGAAAAWCTLARVENDGLQAKRLEPPHAREASCDATADHADAPRCGEAELVANCETAETPRESWGGKRAV